MRIGGRTRRVRQKRKGRDVGVLKGWEAQELLGVIQQYLVIIAVENGLKGGSLEEAKKKRAGSLDHPFYQLLLTVHENMSVP